MRLYLNLLVSVALFALSPMAIAESRVTLTVSSGEYPPFTSENMPHGGFINAIVREAFSNSGYDVHFVYLPWQRAYREMVDGNVDATSYWYKSSERETQALFSDPLLVETTYFFALKPNEALHWNSLADLKPFRIGATQGYTYSEEFWRYTQAKEINVDLAKTDEINFRKLVNGRVDLVPMGYEAGLSLLTKKYPRQSLRRIVLIKKPLASNKAYILFSKNSIRSEILQKTFNDGLRTLKASGRFDALYKKRFLENTPTHLQLPE